MLKLWFVSGKYNSIGISRVIEPYFLPMLVSSSTPVRFGIDQWRAAPIEPQHYSPLSLTTPCSQVREFPYKITGPTTREDYRVGSSSTCDRCHPSSREAEKFLFHPTRTQKAQSVRQPIPSVQSTDFVSVMDSRVIRRTVLRVCASLVTGSLGYLPARFHAPTFSLCNSDLIRKRSHANDVPDLPPLA